MEIDLNAPPACIDPAEIDYICQRAVRTPPGAFVEIGVYKGGVAYYLAKVATLQQRPLYLYDTFTGTPHHGPLDTVPAGSFSDTSIEAVRAAIPTAICVPGVFPESAVDMGPIAFVHLDVDQYEDYKVILPFLESRMVPGGVIWAEDYFVYAGACVAVNEFVRDSARARLQFLHAAVVFP